MPNTAMHDAFARVGVKPAEERLIEIAIKAMVAHADNTAATCDAIWAEVQKDKALVAALFVHGWRREVSNLLHRAQQVISGKATAGALRRPIERRAAEVIQLNRAAGARYEAERAARERESIAAYKAEEERDAQKWLAKWRATKIGTLVISNKPVWQCSVGTVRAWLTTEKRRWATVEALIEGLPDDGRAIEYYRKPEEVAALWGDGR